MAQTEEAAQAMARLEAALERIARCAAAAPPAGVSDVPADLAGRLDALIAQLHHALDGDIPADEPPHGGESGDGKPGDKPGE